MQIILRPARQTDGDELLAIEQQSFSDRSWKRNDFFKFETIVAETQGKIAGFLVSRQSFAGDADSFPEREILNLAVSPSFRRLGIGSALLTEELRAQADVVLEVRASNLGAQALYRRFGFTEVGRRRDYYHSPAETAIVMKMKK